MTSFDNVAVCFIIPVSTNSTQYFSIITFPGANSQLQWSYLTADINTRTVVGWSGVLPQAINEFSTNECVPWWYPRLLWRRSFPWHSTAVSADILDIGMDTIVTTAGFMTVVEWQCSPSVSANSLNPLGFHETKLDHTKPATPRLLRENWKQSVTSL